MVNGLFYRKSRSRIFPHPKLLLPIQIAALVANPQMPALITAWSAHITATTPAYLILLVKPPSGPPNQAPKLLMSAPIPAAAAVAPGLAVGLSRKRLANVLKYRLSSGSIIAVVSTVLTRYANASAA
jgi:hypothetical protein